MNVMEIEEMTGKRKRRDKYGRERGVRERRKEEKERRKKEQWVSVCKGRFEGETQRQGKKEGYLKIKRS